MNDYMKIAIEEAKESLKNEDIPVGALIIKDNNIISKAHNEKELQKDATKHAEILAIERACNKLKTWHLEDCVLMTTMEPCLMCSGAIVQSRMKKIIYGVDNEKFGYSKLLTEKYKIECIKYNDNEEIIELLRNFFKERR